MSRTGDIAVQDDQDLCPSRINTLVGGVNSKQINKQFFDLLILPLSIDFLLYKGLIILHLPIMSLSY